MECSLELYVQHGLQSEETVRYQGGVPWVLYTPKTMTECRSNEGHVLLITGTPGIGKTTVIRRVADGVKATGRRGFYTEEIRDHGERRGFRLVGFGGTQQIIAHVDFPKSHCVGKYGVDLETLDEAAGLLRPDAKARVFIVDEIGKMECLSECFVTAMRALLSGSNPVVASVGMRGGGLIAEVKRRPGCELWQVTHDNRDELPDRILNWLAKTADGDIVN
jgi:nucleoside-triphosphatase